MHSATVSGTIVSGHKEDAVEVPFDPAARFGVASRAVRPGRRGVAVVATIGPTTFATFVVARSRRFWLLLDPATQAAHGWRSGDRIEVALAPTPDGDADGA